MLKKFMCMALSAVMIVMCASCTSGVENDTNTEAEQTNSVNTEAENKTETQEENNAE